MTRRERVGLGGVVLLAAAAAACSSGDGGGGAGAAKPAVCEPGAQQSCGCPGGSTGAQVCRTDGSGWETCLGCAGQGGAAGAVPNSSSGSGGGGGTGGSVTSTGSSGEAGQGGADYPSSGDGGADACIEPDEPCTPTIPDMDADPCCDDPKQGYHCCPVLHKCVVDWWQ
ncbi:MAG: hypothetical protein HY744_22035 [Deltaproteobacteria bacterium]|nr:hypothetical protein [Deltaproteobacteria bacterium]